MSLPTTDSELPCAKCACGTITLITDHGVRHRIVTFRGNLSSSSDSVLCVKPGACSGPFRQHLYAAVMTAYKGLTGFTRLKLPPKQMTSLHELGAHHAVYVVQRTIINKPMQVSFFFTDRKGEIIDVTEYPIEGLEAFGTVEFTFERC